MLHAKDRAAFRVACQNGHLEIAKWLWNVCSEQEQSAMLHAKDDGAFRLVCQNGHLEIAKWLWNVCPEQEQSAMLHAKDDFAFRVVCQNGYLEIAKWVWNVCPEQEQTAMLHVNNYRGAFLLACQNGHLEIAKWLWNVCPEQEQTAMLHVNNYRGGTFRIACEYGHLELAKWLWKVCPDQEQSTMLHAAYDCAFRRVCEKGHLEIAKWLWSICTDQERSTMLHADDDLAFRWACQNGHIEIAKWLLGLCKTAKEQKAMLHARGDYALWDACHYGHQKVAEWLFDLYETDVRLRICKRYKMIHLLWHKLNEFEQIKIFKDQDWLLKKIKSNKSIKDLEALISATQSADVKSDLQRLLYQFHFKTIINALHALNPSFDEYLNYIKGCKDHNKHHFLEWHMDFMVRTAIKAKKSDLLSKVLNALEPIDLIEEHKLAGWLSLAMQEGNTVFQNVCISAIWRKELYQLLEKDNNATYYDSLCAVIRVLFKHGISISVLMDRVIQDEQAGDEQWWCSIYQGVIINMLIEDPTSITHYKHLLESFCEHPLVRYDHEVGSNEDTKYQERCLTIITWFESEFQKAANNSSKWTKDELWRMFQRLSLGSGITMGDDPSSRISKLAIFKQNLKLEIDAKRAQDLDVCSVIDGAGFEEHSGYAPNSASTFFYQGKDKRQSPSCLADNQDQADKKQLRGCCMM